MIWVICMTTARYPPSKYTTSESWWRFCWQRHTLVTWSSISRAPTNTWTAESTPLCTTAFLTLPPRTSVTHILLGTEKWNFGCKIIVQLDSMVLKNYAIWFREKLWCFWCVSSAVSTLIFHSQRPCYNRTPTLGRYGKNNNHDFFSCIDRFRFFWFKFV